MLFIFLLSVCTGLAAGAFCFHDRSQEGFCIGLFLLLIPPAMNVQYPNTVYQIFWETLPPFGVAASIAFLVCLWDWRTNPRTATLPKK